jgi:hypothetical protein
MLYLLAFVVVLEDYLVAYLIFHYYILPGDLLSLRVYMRVLRKYIDFDGSG